MSVRNNTTNNDALALHKAMGSRTRPSRLVFRDPIEDSDMTRDDIDTLCAKYAGAIASDPTTELDSWKVGGKMFVCFGDRIDGFCTKTDSGETAQMLIDAGAATKAPYFHKSWVLVSFSTDPEEAAHRIATSYAIIHKALTKKVRDAL